MEAISSLFSSFGVLGVLVITALIVILVIKAIGCAIMPFVTNIIAGGALYWLLDAFHIVKMNWSTVDAVVIALLGIPGTVLLALYNAFIR